MKTFETLEHAGADKVVRLAIPVEEANRQIALSSCLNRQRRGLQRARRLPKNGRPVFLRLPRANGSASLNGRRKGKEKVSGTLFE